MAHPLVTAARIAIPLVIGAAIGYATRDKEAQEAAARRPEPDPEADLRKELYDRGAHLLGDWDSVEIKAMTHRQYLAYLYRALYCIGRANAQLTEAYATSVATRLASIHHQVRARKDAPIVEWMQDLGFNHPQSLAELLADCKEVQDLDLDPRYIAHAMRDGKLERLSFSGLTAELVAQL